MKKLLLFQVLVTISFFAHPQSPWKDYYKGEKDNKGLPHGKGIMGYGDESKFTCFDGYFVHGKPGDGIHTAEVTKWENGNKTYILKGLLKSKKDKEERFEYSPEKKTIFEITDLVNAYWYKGRYWQEDLVGERYEVIYDGFYYSAKKQLFGEKYFYIKDNDVNTFGKYNMILNLSDCDTRIKNDSLDKYFPQIKEMLINLKTANPQLYTQIYDQSINKLQVMLNIIKRRASSVGLASLKVSDAFKFMAKLENTFIYNPLLNDIDSITVNRITEGVIELAFVLKMKKEFMQFTETFPMQVVQNPRLKRFFFTRLAEKNVHSDYFDVTDYYAYYKDYADLTMEEIAELESNTFERITDKKGVDLYLKLFPNGRHQQLVNAFKNNDYEGLQEYQMNLLDSSVENMKTYIKERIDNGKSDLMDLTKLKSPISEKGSSMLFGLIEFRKNAESLSKIDNDTEFRLYKYLFAALDAKKILSNNPTALQKAEQVLDYISIVNGFWAIDNSFNYNKCVEEDFWGDIVSPSPRRTYTLSDFGIKVKKTFEDAGNTILRRLNVEQDELLHKTYAQIYNYYKSFIDTINGQLAIQNKQHSREKLGNSSFKSYKFEDGKLVITLQNNDVYHFNNKDGKWNLSTGYNIRQFSSLITCSSIAEAIAEAEELNQEYWSQGAK